MGIQITLHIFKRRVLLFVSRGQQTTLLVSFQLSLYPEAIFIPPLLWLFTSEHLYPQGESWSMPGENSLTLFALLSAMQILLIWEELADLSNMIIAPPSPLTAWLRFFWLFLQLFSHSSAETHKVPVSIHWGISQTAQEVPPSRCFMAQIYYSYLSLAIACIDAFILNSLCLIKSVECEHLGYMFKKFKFRKDIT